MGGPLNLIIKFVDGGVRIVPCRDNVFEDDWIEERMVESMMVFNHHGQMILSIEVGKKCINIKVSLEELTSERLYQNAV